MPFLKTVFSFFLLIACQQSAIAEPSSSFDSDLRLFDGVWKNTADSFTGINIFYHLAAIGSTSVLIKSGYDAQVFETFRYTPNDAAWPGAIFGSGVGALTA